MDVETNKKKGKPFNLQASKFLFIKFIKHMAVQYMYGQTIT